MASALQIVRSFFPEVEKVVDGTKRITVYVTEIDSKSSTVKNHSHCALAVACKNQERADGVIVSVKTVYIVKGKRAFRYQNLESTSREIVSFDREGGFAPGEYLLKPPDVKLGALPRGKRHPGDPSDGTLKKKAFNHRTTNIRTSMSAKGGA